MIKGLVFDIGGVLLRTEDRSKRRELEFQYGLPEGGADELVFNSSAANDSTIGLIGRDAIWENVAQRLSLSEDQLMNFLTAFWSGDRIDSELLDFLQTSRKTYTTALLSNAWLNFREELSQKFDIREGQTVDYIFISSELGVAKPDKRIYHILSEKIQICFSEILFIDDFIENITAAKDLGINTIHYQPGMNLIYEIQSIKDKS